MPRTALVVLAVVALIGALTAACTDNADSESSASQESVEQVMARVQRNEMITTLLTIGDIPLHDMDESIAAGTIESNFIPDTREALRLLALTEWDSALADDAEAIRASAAELLAALRDGDVDAAAEPSAALHEGWHQFESDAWDVITADLPPGEGGPEPEEDDHGEGGMTPTADETPGDDHGGETPAADATDDDHGDDAPPEAESTP
jgi:hypothetical protein